MANAVATLGKTPFNIQFSAADAAGAAFQTALIIDRDIILLYSIDISRTQIETCLVAAFFYTFLVVYDAQMAYLIHLKTV